MGNSLKASPKDPIEFPFSLSLREVDHHTPICHCTKRRWLAVRRLVLTQYALPSSQSRWWLPSVTTILYEILSSGLLGNFCQKKKVVIILPSCWPGYIWYTRLRAKGPSKSVIRGSKKFVFLSVALFDCHEPRIMSILKQQMKINGIIWDPQNFCLRLVCNHHLLFDHPLTNKLCPICREKITTDLFLADWIPLKGNPFTVTPRGDFFRMQPSKIAFAANDWRRAKRGWVSQPPQHQDQILHWRPGTSCIIYGFMAGIIIGVSRPGLSLTQPTWHRPRSKDGDKCFAPAMLWSN